MNGEKDKSPEHVVPSALTTQEQKEFWAMWKKLSPTQRNAIKAFIEAMLEK